jgi:uncharacterized membrane protein YdjX (TVP38/TMEM64 family)
MKKFDRSFWINAGFLVIIIGILVSVSIEYTSEITRLMSNPKKFREFILSYGQMSVLVFMLFQIFQVVIAIIPGEIVQILGGYIFGTFWGTVYSFIGITTGYIIVFLMVRFFGYRLVKQMVSEVALQKFYCLINSPGSDITVFLLFLIPGVPKDILVYIAGLTPIKPFTFFIIISIARVPAMIGASYIGSNIQMENYIAAIIIFLIACILFIIGFMFKNRIITILKNML